MQTITQYLSDEHKHCDDLFVEAEEAATNNDLAGAVAKFNAFHQEMVRHLMKEENIMFPAYEEITSSYNTGPTSIMRMEHGQMRRLFEDIEAALEQKDTKASTGLLETLLMVMQQHNAKEEQMLYQMADRKLGNRVDIIRQMDAMP